MRKMLLILMSVAGLVWMQTGVAAYVPAYGPPLGENDPQPKAVSVTSTCQSKPACCQTTACKPKTACCKTKVCPPKGKDNCCKNSCQDVKDTSADKSPTGTNAPAAASTTATEEPTGPYNSLDIRRNNPRIGNGMPVKVPSAAHLH